MNDWDNISDAIFYHAERRPDAPALIDGPKILTWRDFASLVRAAAVHLRARGIKADDRIGVALPNSAAHLVLSFALMRIGAVPAEIAYGMDAKQVDDLINSYGLRALVSDYTRSSAPGVLNFDLGPNWQRYLAQSQGDARDERGAGENHLISFSSGSTGTPKATLTSHRHRMVRARAYFELLGDRWSAEHPGIFLVTSTVGHAGFHEYMMNQVFIGGPVVLIPGLAYNSDLLRLVGAYENAVCLVTPYACRGFLQSPGGQRSLPGVQAMISAGMPLFAEEKRALLGRVTPNFYECYGASGFGAITMLRPEDMAGKAESVGRPSSAATLEIVDANGQRLPAGKTGRLRCRGETMAIGFIGRGSGDATLEGFHDGWYYPGDLAAIDGDGYLHLRGRVADRITQNGIEIYPTDIEQAILAHPGVREVAVVGRPAAAGGEEAVAYVVCAQGIHGEELAKHCGQRLASETMPRAFHIAAELPRLPNGKVDRQAIKAFAARLDTGA